MKVVICLSIGLGIFLFSVNAQDSAKIMIQYKLTYVIDTTQPETPDFSYFKLLIGKHTSKYDDYIDESSGAVYTSIMSRQPIYKFFSSKTLVREIPLPQVVYAIKENIPMIDWVVGKEQKKILGYQCQSASGTYRGRNYTAWFATKLPYNNGPWKFGGLPGLILEIYDDKNEITWETQKISTDIDPTLVPIQLNKNDITVTADEYKKLKEAMMKDGAAMRGAVTSTQQLASGVRVVVTPSNGVAGGRNMRIFNNPIEKN